MSHTMTSANAQAVRKTLPPLWMGPPQFTEVLTPGPGSRSLLGSTQAAQVEETVAPPP